MNHVEVIEGFEVAIAALLEKVFICEFYAGIYIGVPLSSRSTASGQQLQSMQDFGLPELYAAIIVFSVKAHTYFEARGTYIILYAKVLNCSNSKLGIARITNTLKPFDIVFQPFIEEINAKERAIREYADAASMERIRSTILYMVLNIIRRILTHIYIQALRVSFRILHQN